MRISPKPSATDRKALAKRVVLRAVQSIETLESRVMLAAQMSTTVLQISPNPATAGQNVTLQASVFGAGGTPTGTVTFVDTDTNTTLGSYPLVVGSAETTSDTTLPVGTDHITATYSGDANFQPSNDVNVEVIQSASTGNTPSVTTVASSSAGNTSNAGDSVTFTATVTSGATGQVDFTSNGSSIGSATINSGTYQASVTVTTLAAGSDNIIASYEGDATYRGSAGSVTQTVNAVSGTTPTTTTLGSSSMSITAGQSITFTATVNNNTATGTVDFTSGATDLSGLVTVTNGVATFTTTSLTAGNYAVVATYSGDSNFKTSASNPPESVTVTAAALTNTTTTVTTSSSTVAVGSPVTFTATVNNSSATGSVDFTSGMTDLSGPVTVVNGVASFTTSSLGAGTYAIVGTYGGDGSFAGSTSNPPVTETVNSSGLTSTTTTIATSAPAIVAGSSVTFTATVNNASATGTVDFTSGSTDLSGPVTLSNGVATFTTSSLAVGVYMVDATYIGDSHFAGSTSNPPVTETVNSLPLTSTTTAIQTSAATVQAGNPVTFTATVTPGAATGTVDFFNGTTDLSGPITVSGGVATFTTSSLAAAVYNVDAVYNGASRYATSTSPTITETVNPAPGTTTTVLNVSSLNPGFGSAVTLTASVMPTTAGGTVTFFDGTTQIGSPVGLVNGTAVLSTATLPLGVDTLTATYNGDVADSTSTSPAVMVTVGQGTPVLTIATSSPSIALGATVTFTATVGPQSVGGGVPTGTVQFLDNGNALGAPDNLVNGMATFATNTLTVGTHSITYTYSGDTNYLSTTSGIVTQTVTPAASLITLTAAPSPGVYQQTVTLTATITPLTATGTVDFFYGTTDLSGPIAVINGVATYTTAALPTGTDSLTATYNGDGNDAPSTSPAITEVIRTAPSSITLSTSNSMSVYGNPITLTANVPTTGATGTVTFFDNGSTNLGRATLVGGDASITISNLPVGTDSITAVYSGNTNLSASASAALTETVTTAPTTTTLSATPMTVAVGAPVDLTVTVASVSTGTATPTGTVTILEDGVVIQSGVPLFNGTAILSLNSVPLGLTTLTAVYSGDSNYMTSTSAGVPVTVLVPTSSTSATTITSSATSITYGDPVTFTATVASALLGGITPTGTIQFFYNGTVSFGSPTTLVGGVATLTTTALPPGTDNVIAVYSGDSNYTPSQSGEATEIVAPTTGTYVTTVTAPSSAQFGSPVVLTAIVTPATISTPPATTGTVTFFVGNQTIGAADVNPDGTATFSTPLPAGAITVTASYQSGGPTNAMSLPASIVVSSPATLSLAKAKLPAAALAGLPFRATLPVMVTNLSNQPLKGNFTLDVYLNTDPTLDSNKMLLSNVPQTFSLGAGKSKSYRLVESVGGMPAGTYYMVAEITDPNGLTNLTASKPIVVAAPFVSPVLTLGPVSPANIAPNGNASITVTVTNAGNETASGLLELTLGPASGAGVVIPGVTLAVLSPPPFVTLQPGTSRKFHLEFNVAGLAAGTYTPAATVTLAGVSSSAVGSHPFVVGDLHNTIPPSPFSS